MSDTGKSLHTMSTERIEALTKQRDGLLAAWKALQDRVDDIDLSHLDFRIQASHAADAAIKEGEKK